MYADTVTKSMKAAINETEEEEKNNSNIIRKTI